MRLQSSAPDTRSDLPLHRRPAVHRTLACMGALLGVLMVFALSPAQWRGGLTTDVDSQMRMAFLEWAATHGHLTDYLFPRDGAPGGMLLHWTLPYDLLALGIAAPLSALRGWHAALFDTALVAGPLSFLAGCAAIAALCRAAGVKQATPWALAITATATSLVGYTGIGRLTHHGVTAALGTMALAAALWLCRRGRARDGAWAAAWMVLAAWESIELVPALLVAWAAVMAGACLRRRCDRGFLVYAVILPLGALVALMVDPEPRGFLTPSVDRFSIFHVVMFGVLGMGVALATRFRGDGTPFWRLTRGAMAAAPMLVGILYLGYRLLPPELTSDAIMNIYMHNSEAELKPAWTDVPHMVNAIRPGVFIILIPLLGLVRSIRRPQRVLWLVMLVVLGLEFAVGVRYARLAPYGAAVGCVLLGASLRRWTCMLTQDRTGQRAAVAFALLACAGYAFLTPQAEVSLHAIRSGSKDLANTCVIGPGLAADIERVLPPDAIVASDLWFSPELLWRTHLRTVAGPYHRNVDGIHDVALMFAGEGDIGFLIARKRHVTALLACTLPIRADDDIYDDGSLERRLAHGDIPPWLEKVPGVGEGRFGLYKVKAAVGSARPAMVRPPGPSHS